MRGDGRRADQIRRAAADAGYVHMALGDAGAIFALIFGGCCSNALALELTTKQLPSSGTLITLAQFVSTALLALLGQWDWYAVGRWRLPWIRRPHVPLSRWLVQVVLYFATSILNNTAFAYNIPMSVHIVFRSGGMVVNMVLGWGVDRKRYSLLQVLSVCLVTAGVVTATLAASTTHGSARGVQTGDYATGVLLLSLALLSSGLMGIYQEHTYRRYGREHWHEALLYSHLFALPLFLLQRRGLAMQVRAANATRPSAVGVGPWRVALPSYYVNLAMNVLTQLLCINGVNRLTARVSSLSVSLILVVRKAASLLISVVLLNHQSGNGGLWAGAGAVMVGTIGYAYGGLRGMGPTPVAKKTA
ncbi:golgi uridine diphosphate-N- acetylglucosamine transporter [Malassezia sp. CBS 17886]|nr:golgi uridine diphosphate-N- acetylglucosamine transporter [Malassezia sp. CBS 17886]